jgi:hypothetical protein
MGARSGLTGINGKLSPAIFWRKDVKSTALTNACWRV